MAPRCASMPCGTMLRYMRRWQEEDSVVIAENKQLVRSFYAAGNRGDFDACFDLIAEGELVVALTSGVAETVDGRPYNNRYCQVMRINDGRIVEVAEYLDTQLTSAIFGNR